MVAVTSLVYTLANQCSSHADADTKTSNKLFTPSAPIIYQVGSFVLPPSHIYRDHKEAGHAFSSYC